jgi:hypothetical protein
MRGKAAAGIKVSKKRASPISPRSDDHFGCSDISDLDLRRLRVAIRKNRVTFPSTVPIFSKLSRADIQWRIALLFFVRGWSCPEIGRRYGFRKQRAQQLLSQWTSRAVTLGYIQPIRPEMEACVGEASNLPPSPTHRATFTAWPAASVAVRQSTKPLRLTRTAKRPEERHMPDPSAHEPANVSMNQRLRFSRA